MGKSICPLSETGTRRLMETQIWVTAPSNIVSGGRCLREGGMLSPGATLTLAGVLVAALIGAEAALSSMDLRARRPQADVVDGQARAN